MLPASFIQMERLWRSIATYVINLCVDHVVFTYRLIRLGAGGWGIHKRNMLTEVDHIGHKFG